MKFNVKQTLVATAAAAFMLASTGCATQKGTWQERAASGKQKCGKPAKWGGYR